MAFQDDRFPGLDFARIIRVQKPTLTMFSSFEAAIVAPDLRSRDARVRKDWARTDPFHVQDFSYSFQSLRIFFESMTLEIMACDSIVDWRLHDGILSSWECLDAPFLLINDDYGNKPVVFDPVATLTPILGRHIRYAPSINEIYLSWARNTEIGMFSKPISDGTGNLLYFD